MYTYIHIHTYTIYVYTCTPTHTYIHPYIYTHTQYLHGIVRQKNLDFAGVLFDGTHELSQETCVYIHTHAYEYICTYIHTHTYIFTSIHIHTHTQYLHDIVRQKNLDFAGVLFNGTHELSHKTICAVVTAPKQKRRISKQQRPFSRIQPPTPQCERRSAKSQILHLNLVKILKSQLYSSVT